MRSQSARKCDSGPGGIEPPPGAVHTPRPAPAMRCCSPPLLCRRDRILERGELFDRGLCISGLFCRNAISRGSHQKCSLPGSGRHAARNCCRLAARHPAPGVRPDGVRNPPTPCPARGRNTPHRAPAAVLRRRIPARQLLPGGTVHLWTSTRARASCSEILAYWSPPRRVQACQPSTGPRQPAAVPPGKALGGGGAVPLPPVEPAPHLPPSCAACGGLVPFLRSSFVGD